MWLDSHCHVTADKFAEDRAAVLDRASEAGVETLVFSHIPPIPNALVRRVWLRGVSDAFDGDFSEGRIEGGTIRDAGGDAIDVSGSRVDVRDVGIQGIGDKAVSVGEASTLSASGLRIQSVGTAFVSKDRSLAELRDSLELSLNAEQIAWLAGGGPNAPVAAP